MRGDHAGMTPDPADLHRRPVPAGDRTGGEAGPPAAVRPRPGRELRRARVVTPARGGVAARHDGGRRPLAGAAVQHPTALGRAVRGIGRSSTRSGGWSRARRRPQSASAWAWAWAVVSIEVAADLPAIGAGTVGYSSSRCEEQEPVELSACRRLLLRPADLWALAHAAGQGRRFSRSGGCSRGGDVS